MFFLLLFGGCRLGQPPEAMPIIEAEGQIVIVHTNDLHAHFRPSSSEAGLVGGAEAISAHVESLREQWGDDRLLFLDAGDIISGSPLDNYEVSGVRGGAMVELLEALKYDAWTIGNHEFDGGVEQAAGLVKASDIPVLSANLDNPDGSPALGMLNSKIFEVGPYKVQVIGVTTENLAGMTNKGLGSIVIKPAEEAVRQELAEGVDLHLALSHLGFEKDKELAERVPELDLIVGGHSHTWLTEPERVGNTIILQAGSYAQGVGVAVLTPQPDDAAQIEYVLARPSADKTEGALPEVKEFVNRWGRIIDREWGEAVGHSELHLWRSGDEESPMGRFVGMALRKGTSADVAVYNAGGLRADFQKGPITRADLHAAFPFGNEVVVVEVTGADLYGLALRNANAMFAPEISSVIQQQGLSYTYRKRLNTAELISLQVNRQRVEPDEVYRIATSDFMVSHWSRLMGQGQSGKVTGTGKTVAETVGVVLKEGPITEIPPKGGILVE
ncbi:MAG: bifunctional metallophosphatase/5'-nucleotidase [Proteobacteria bacterium]|jgi:5'-nucleotidase / UDP-sugar diphosphatase|nr:bifunctional metallophosphatase/5'-nucleotidase [Pseudomonadota bacterium]